MVSRGTILKIVGVIAIFIIVLLTGPTFKYYMSVSVKRVKLIPRPKEIYPDNVTTTVQTEVKLEPKVVDAQGKQHLVPYVVDAQGKQDSEPSVVDAQRQHNLVPNVVDAQRKHNLEPNVVDAQQNTTNLKYFVYLCDENRRCGGWGDRQRGIVTAFIWARLLNRTYKIVMTTACDLTQFYQPNEINWILDENEIKNKSTKILDVMNRHDITVDKDFKPYQHIDVLYVKTNNPKFLLYRNLNLNLMPDYLKGLNGLDYRMKIFKAVWSRLMMPTERMTNQILNVTKPMFIDGYRADLVTAHVRIGRSQYMPYERVVLSLDSTDIILNFLDKYKHSKIYVATDHADVRKAAIAKLGKRYIGSYAPFLNPDNTARGTKLACWAFEMTLVDQLVMSSADVLVTSPSGLSTYAAYLNPNSGEIYRFDGTTVMPYHPL